MRLAELYRRDDLALRETPLGRRIVHLPCGQRSGQAVWAEGMTPLTEWLQDHVRSCPAETDQEPRT